MSTNLILFHKFLQELLPILNTAVRLIGDTSLAAEEKIAAK